MGLLYINAGNAIMNPLALRLSMVAGYCLQPCDPSFGVLCYKNSFYSSSLLPLIILIDIVIHFLVDKKMF